jgi:hypothetical protein
MSLLRGALDGVAAGVIDPLPIYLQPGLFAALCFLAGWAVIRWWRAIWDWGLRSGTTVAAALTALALLPEYAHTRSRRLRGEPPSRLATSASPLAVSVLDILTDIREDHPHRPSRSPAKPPWRWALAIVALPMVVYAVTRQPAGADFVPLADAIFSHWQSLRSWAAA